MCEGVCRYVTKCRGTWAGGEDREITPGLLGKEGRRREEERLGGKVGRVGGRVSGKPKLGAAQGPGDGPPWLRSKLTEVTLEKTLKERTQVFAGLEGICVTVPSDLMSSMTCTQLTVRELDLWA